MPRLLPGVLLVCALMAANAGGKVKAAPTDLEVLRAGPDAIGVSVSSSFKRCTRDREVVIADGALSLATATTDREGNASIGVDQIPPTLSALSVVATEARVANRSCAAASEQLATDSATLTGGASGGAFGGRLDSTVATCEPGRVISVYEVSSEPVFVGFNFTDAEGDWTLAAAGGMYEARVGSLLAGSGADFIVCRAAVSAPWTFEEPPEE
jgi:hypothetical protein